MGIKCYFLFIRNEVKHFRILGWLKYMLYLFFFFLCVLVFLRNLFNKGVHPISVNEFCLDICNNNFLICIMLIISFKTIKSTILLMEFLNTKCFVSHLINHSKTHMALIIFYVYQLGRLFCCWFYIYAII